MRYRPRFGRGAAIYPQNVRFRVTRPCPYGKQSNMSRTAIIGAGVTGVLTAYHLDRHRHQVCLFDKNEQAAMETSFANGGQISASNAEVWNNWHTVRSAFKSMFGPDAPLKIGAKPDRHKLSWFTEFAYEGLRQAKNTERLVRMALRSRERLRDIARLEQIDFDMRESGLMHVHRTKTQFETAARANKVFNASGLERRAVTPDEIRALEPALAGDYYGGFYTPGDFSGDVHKFTQGLLAICRDERVETRFGVGVIDISSVGGTIRISLDTGEDMTFDNVVICAGVGSRRLAAMLGDRVNVYPVKGYSLTLDIAPDTAKEDVPNVALLDDAAKIVTSRLGQRVRIAGLAEFRGADLSIDPARAAVLERWAKNHFPRLVSEHTTTWTGLRPMMPSMTPTVGPGRKKGVFYNTGHGHLGWTLSAGTAEAIAEIVDET